MYVDLPFCFQNERISRNFIKQFNEHTNDQFDLRIKWQTRKVKSLFQLKDKNPYPSRLIYKGTCSCGEEYIGETKRNALDRWSEHENSEKGTSEPAKHLRRNIGHKFNWTILSNAPKGERDRKNLEAYFIILQKPSLNNQVKFNDLILFRHGIT